MQARLDDLLPNLSKNKQATWLAAQIESDQRTVLRWLDGVTKPRIDQAIPIARTLGVKVWWLLSDDPTDEDDVPVGAAPSRRPEPRRTRTSDGSTERRQGTRDRRQREQE